ncbi:MAG TPA: MFS transporter [Rhizomicrobium sp.]|nr:MFS transporter [Rhizomicrobium sp.]
MPNPVTYRSLLRIADMPALLAATTFSRLAGRMFSLAIVLYALERFHSPALAGWLSFAAVVPGLVISPMAGALLDRIGPVAAIAIDMAASATLMLAMIAADWLGFANPAALLALVAIYSLTNPLSRSGVRTLLPRLVPKDALDAANGLDTAIYAAIDVVGPGLAGVLIGFGGSLPTLILIALTFGAAAFFTARIHHLPPPRAAHTTFLRETVEGVSLVLREPTLRSLAFSYSLYQVTWGALVVAVPVFAIQSFAPAYASTMTGFLWAASGIAGGVAALVTGRVRTTGRERSAMALGMIITALACWPLSSEFGVAGLLLGLTIVSAAGGPVDVGLLTLRQRRTDPAKLGRVLSVSMSLNVVGYPIGSALAGLIVTQSLSATFALAAAASVLATIAVLMIPKDQP